MLRKLEIIGLHVELDQEVRPYVIRKLANLDHYIPRHGRISAKLEVRLEEQKIDGHRQAICEATLYLPRRIINLKEHAETLWTAIDLVHTGLQQQIGRYKETHTVSTQRRHRYSRSGRRLSNQAVATVI